MQLTNVQKLVLLSSAIYPCTEEIFKKEKKKKTFLKLTVTKAQDTN